MSIMRAGCLAIATVFVFVHAYDNTTSPYGVCAHLPGEGDLRTELRAMQNAGIGWVRADFSWGAVEPQNGSFTFTRYDDVVRVADSLHIGILPILCYDAAWGDTAWRRPDLWTAYVDTIVRRYKSSLKYWEVWNEENIQFWKDGTAQREAHYAGLLKTTYETIKAIDPQLQVLVGGTAGVPFDYIDSLYNKGSRAYFDIMNVHPYRWPAVPELPAASGGYTMYGQLLHLREVMRTEGDSAKPYWITEVGWPTHVPDLAFWGGQIRAGLRRAVPGKSRWKGAFLDDAGYPPSLELTLSDAGLVSALPGAGSTITRVRLDQLATLAQNGFDVLVMPPGESFPSDYFADIRAFVKNGGTLVLTGGVPLYYAQVKSAQGVWTSSGAPSTYRQQLHFNYEAWWTNPLAPQSTTSLVVVPPFADSIRLTAGTAGTRFIIGANLQTGDTLIPVISARTGTYEAPVTALIKYNSDSLTGATVISTLPVGMSGISPDRQAAMLPRAVLISLQAGVSRVFWYEFQAPESDSFYSEDHFGITHRDFSPKPAYRAYQALTRVRPAGSSIGAGGWVSSDSTLYFPHWQRPDGRSGWALWTLGTPRTCSAEFIGTVDSVISHLGDAVPFTVQGNTVALVLSGNPLYVIGPAALSLSPVGAVHQPRIKDAAGAVSIVNSNRRIMVRVDCARLPVYDVTVCGLDGKTLYRRTGCTRSAVALGSGRGANRIAVVTVTGPGVVVQRRMTINAK